MLTTAATWIMTLATIAQAGGVSTTKTWKKVAPAGGDFQVMMPGAPKEQTTDVPVENLGQVKLNSFLFDSKARAYSVMYGDYPAEAKFDVLAALKGARDGALKNLPGAKPTEDKEIELNGVPGLEVKAELPARGGNPEGMFHLRLYFVKNRLYQVVTIGPKTNQNSLEVTRFFKSFKLLGDHAKPGEIEAAGAKIDAVGKADAGGWKRFSRADLGFSARFPGKPSEKVTNKVTPSGLLKMSHFGVSFGASHFSVVHSDRKVGLDFNARNALEAARDGSMKAFDITETIDDREINLDDVPGREFAFRIPAKASRPEMVYRARIFARKAGFYQAVVVSPPDSADSPDVMRFLDSFQFTDDVAKADPADGAAKPGTWKTFEPDGGRFSVSFPGEPVKSEQTVKVNQLEIKIVQYTLDRGPIGYIVAYNDYPAGAQFDVDKVLAGGRDGSIAASPGAKLIDDKAITLETVPGREFSTRVPAKNGAPEVIMKTRVYLKNKRLHQIMAVRQADLDEPADFASYFDSFKLLDAENRAGAPGPRRRLPPGVRRPGLRPPSPR